MILKNYLKIFLRNLIKQPGYSFINILGFAVGLTCCILVFLWVQHELSYDKFHSNLDELHLAAQIQNFPDRQVIAEITPPAIGPVLKKDYPEIVNSARVTSQGCLLNFRSTIFYETIHFADPSFFEMFTFPLVKGDPKTVLSGLSSIIITQKMAKKYFGKNDPIGEIIRVDEKYDFRISGVLKDFPPHSSIRCNFVVPIENIKNWGIELNRWGSSRFLTFVQLQKKHSYKKVSLKISNLFRRYMSKENIRDVFLHPFSRFHLYSVDGKGGLINYISLFSLIALFVLFIACINFINLTTARAPTRAKEIGLRKVIGANRKDLIKQFLGESVLMIFIAIIVAIILAKLLLPILNAFLGKQLDINLFTNLQGFGVLIGIVFFASLLAGSYPALILSAFQPVNILQRIGESRNRKAWLRKILVVGQFAISVILIISTAVVYKQLDYIKNRDLGLEKKNIMTISSKGSMEKKHEAFKNELLKNSDILNVTIASHLPTNIANWSGGWSWEGEKSSPAVIMEFATVGYDFTDTLKISMKKGRFYSRNFSDDHSVVVNEKAAAVMGLEEPIGKRLSFIGRDFKIIGVVKNFHSRPLYHDIQPLVLMFGNSKILRGVIPYRYMFIKMNPTNIAKTIEYVKRIYNTFFPGYDFESEFLDEDFDDIYEMEKRLGKIFSYSASLAAFISCLGLLGLASFMAQQRTGEIAVRKVFGASVPAIIALLSKEFVRLVLAANALAWVIAHFGLNIWLQSFAYRTDLSWWIFITVGAFSLCLALLMVSFQTVKVAFQNPVDSLKHE